MSKFLLLLLIACLPAFVFAQAPLLEKVVVPLGLSVTEEDAISAAKSTDWEPGPSVTIGRTRWTCSLLPATAESGDVNGGGQLGVCTVSTTGMRVHVKLPPNWSELPPTSLLPYLESGHAAEVNPLLPHKYPPSGAHRLSADLSAALGIIKGLMPCRRSNSDYSYRPHSFQNTQHARAA
jgi:hypothetical protein